MKARNENYEQFKQRFEQSISRIMAKYDELRNEENRFEIYWKQNLTEIAKKHI